MPSLGGDKKRPQRTKSRGGPSLGGRPETRARGRSISRRREGSNKKLGEKLRTKKMKIWQVPLSCCRFIFRFKVAELADEWKICGLADWVIVKSGLQLLSYHKNKSYKVVS